MYKVEIPPEAYDVETYSTEDIVNDMKLLDKDDELYLEYENELKRRS